MSAISRYQIYPFLIINSWENGQNVIRGDFFGPKNTQNSHFEGFWRQSAHVFYYFHNSKVKNKFPQKYLGGICTFTYYSRKNVGQNVANLCFRNFAALRTLNFCKTCYVTFVLGQKTWKWSFLQSIIYYMTIYIPIISLKKAK